MKKELLLIDPHIPKEEWAESYVSFSIFTAFLQNEIATGHGIKLKYYQYVLDKILAWPGMQSNIPIQEIHHYEDLLELVSTIVFPLMEDENDFFWAFGSALTPEVFYESNAFYNLITSYSELNTVDEFLTAAESSDLVKELQYEIILQKLYSYNKEQKKEWIHRFVNPVNGLYQYYRINVDTRFTALKTKTTLPHMDKKEIEACLASADGVQQLENILPLKNMVAKGFTIITLTNVTGKQALEQISKEVVGFEFKNRVTAFKQRQLYPTTRRVILRNINKILYVFYSRPIFRMAFLYSYC